MGVLHRGRYIVVHHPADDNIQKTLRDHVHPPFTDAPYDYWLEYPTGEIVKGRVLTKRGAHVIPDYPQWKFVNNDSAIGIAFEGNFDDEKPPLGPSPQQIERGALLIAQLLIEYGRWPHSTDRAIEQIQADGGVLPHGVVSNTACPGRHFMKEWDALMGKVRWYFTSLRGSV